MDVETKSMHGWRLALILFLVATAVVWVLFATQVAPGIIEKAHANESWSPLNRLISGRNLGYYRKHWETVTLGVPAMCVMAIALLLLIPGRLIGWYYRKFVHDASPDALGAIRMLASAILLVSVIWEDMPSSALLPRDMMKPMGIISLLQRIPGYDAFAASQSALEVFELVTALFLFLAMVGWKTRLVVPMAAVCYLVYGGMLRQYFWFYHTGLVPTYVLAVLSFTPCGHGMSLDRLLRARRGEPPRQPGPRYGWSRYACWIVVVLPYVEAGASKFRIGGLDWGNPTNMKAALFRDTLVPMEFDWGLSLYLTKAPDVFFWILGTSAVLLELAVGLMLFSRIARFIMPAMNAAMHVGIWLLQNILFFDLIFLQLMFYDFSGVKEALVRWWTERFGPIAQPAAAAQEVQTPPERAVWAPAALIALTTFLGLVWVAAVDLYPITAMQMYAVKKSSPVYYTKVFVVRESGTRERSSLEDAIGALGDGRCRRIVLDAFRRDRAHQTLAKDFLAAVCTQYNRQAPKGQRVTAIELEKWRWDFEREPTNPQYGERMGTFVYEVPRTES